MEENLLQCAKEALKNSYSIYSNFAVGAALLSENDIVYTGCNVENSSFNCGICAERAALFTAICEGERKFKAIAVCGKNKSGFVKCLPCGLCLQALSEFCDSDFKIIVEENEKPIVYKLSELLPMGFKL